MVAGATGPDDRHEPSSLLAADQALAFLAASGAALGASLDYEATLDHVVRLAVPALADWCVADLRGDDGALRQIAGAHADPALEPLILELRRRFPPGADHPISRAMQRGEPLLGPPSADPRAEQLGSPEYRALQARLGSESYIIVPLHARQRTLGAISFVLGASGRRYGTADLAVAQALATHAALAIDNALLFRSATARAEKLGRLRAEADRLADLLQALNGSLDLDETLGRIAQAGLDLLGGATCGLALPEADGLLHYRAVRGEDHGAGADYVFAPGDGFVGRAFLERRPQRTDDLWATDATHQPDLDRRARIRALLCAPLLLGGQSLGVLTAASTEPGAYDADDEEFLGRLAVHAALALDRARQHAAEVARADELHRLSEELRREEGRFRDLYAEAQRELARRWALLRVARRLAGDSDPLQVLLHLLTEAEATLGSDFGVAYRWDEAEGVLVAVGSTAPEPLRSQLVRIPLGQGVTGLAAERRKPVVLNDYQRVGGWPHSGHLAIQAAMAVPLLYEGRLFGVLGIGAYRPAKRFEEEDVQTLELLAGIAAAVLVGSEQARLGGALLAARTMQHELNNKLAIAVGYAELLALAPDLPARLREQAAEALRGATEASVLLERLRGLTQIQERNWGGLVATTIDLSRAEAG